MDDDLSDGPKLIDLSTGEEVKQISKPISIMPTAADDYDDMDEEVCSVIITFTHTHVLCNLGTSTT